MFFLAQLQLMSIGTPTAAFHLNRYQWEKNLVFVIFIIMNAWFLIIQEEWKPTLVSFAVGEIKIDFQVSSKIPDTWVNVETFLMQRDRMIPQLKSVHPSLHSWTAVNTIEQNNKPYLQFSFYWWKLSLHSDVTGAPQSGWEPSVELEGPWLFYQAATEPSVDAEGAKHIPRRATFVREACGT